MKEKRYDHLTIKGYSIPLYILAPLAIALVTALVYIPTFSYDFIYDDLPTIVHYYHIRFFDPIGQLFANSRWVSRVFNQATYHYFGMSPSAFRIINLMLLISIGVMIFFIVYRLLKNVKRQEWLRHNALTIAGLTSALFLLHPVQTQTATYISQMRLEGLVVFFVSAVITFFILAVSAHTPLNKYLFYGLSLLFALIGTGTKESIIVLPLLLILVDWFFVAQGEWPSIKSRLPIHGLYMVVVWGMLYKYGYVHPSFYAHALRTEVMNNRGNVLTGSVNEYIKSYSYIISQFKIILHYLTIFFTPFRVAFDYNYTLSRSIFELSVLLPCTILLALSSAMLLLLRRNPCHAVVFCYAWFIVSIFPRASIIPSTELVCDYKTYLSSIGVLLFIAMSLVYLFQIIMRYTHLKKHFYHAAGAFCGFVVCLGISSYSRNTVWSHELAFYEDLAKKCPKARWYNNLGTAQLDLGKREEALKSFQKSVELDNWYAEPHINLGCAYQQIGDVDNAFKHYARALEIGEGHPELFNNLGLLHLSTQNYASAELCFKKSLELKPYYSRAHMHLGAMYHQQNKLEQALDAYEKAINGDRQTTELFYTYATLANTLNKHDKAIAAFERLDKNYQETAFMLACSYYAQRNYDKAVENFSRAYQKHPDNKIYVYNFAQALMTTGKYQAAASLFEQCCGDETAFPYASLHRARCLYDMGQRESGITLAKNIMQITKNDAIKNDVVQFMKDRGIA